MGEIIKGKPVADCITEKLVQETEMLTSKGIIPTLAILRVGVRGEDLAYEKGALGRCKKAGIDVNVVELAADVTQEKFIESLEQLNNDDKVNGILIFRPLPSQLDESIVKYIISPEKDIDGMSPVNVGKMTEGDESGFPPCTPTAVVEILKYYNVGIQGKNATIIGASMVVGKPAALLLLNEKATVTVCHLDTKDTAAMSAQADIIVAGAGSAKLVKENWVSEGAVVIDVGINVDNEGNMCGDVDFENVSQKASMITPVPGGVGSVTTSILAKHVIKACKQQNSL